MLLSLGFGKTLQVEDAERKSEKMGVNNELQLQKHGKPSASRISKRDGPQGIYIRRAQQVIQ